MKKFSLTCVCFILCIFSLLCLAGCDKNETPAESNKKVLINNVNYDSLTEAVKNAKSGDTIRIYDDLNEHKNVIIDKPLNIEGVLSASRVKPKFYGSIMIETDGENDSVSVKNLDIIHDATLGDNLVNDTRVGVNIIDGGFTMQFCHIGPMSDDIDKDAVGLVISRKKGSTNIMPIEIKGNSFDAYKLTDGLSCAFLIKSGGDFEKLSLDNDKLYSENVFTHTKEGVQFISLALPKEEYPFLVTTSADVLVKALKNNQSKEKSAFRLIVTGDLKEKEDDVTVLENTTINIEGNNSCSMNGQKLVNFGVINVDAELKDLTIERGSSSANLIFSEKKDDSVIVK